MTNEVAIQHRFVPLSMEISLDNEEVRLNFSKAIDLYINSTSDKKLYDEGTLNGSQDREIEINGLVYDYCIKKTNCLIV